MAKTYVQDGHTVTMLAPTGGVVSGTGVLIGQQFGIALTTAAAGLAFELGITGVFRIAKTSALQIDVGDVVYWDDTNKVVNKTSSAQKEIGIAMPPDASGVPSSIAAANPSATVNVRLVSTPRTSVAA